MRLPPWVAVECHTSDMIGVLNRLEDVTRVRYCRHCFGVGQRCRCSVVPHQAPGQTMALWSPPVMSYAAMASSTETIASTSTVGVMASRTSGTSGMPLLEPMETSPPLTTADLLLTAGVGRGTRGWTLPWAPTPLALASLDQGHLPHKCPPPRGREPQHRPLTSSRFLHLQPPPPGRAPPHVPLGARDRRGQLTKKLDPGEGQHLEAPGMDNKTLDPPPEDLACGDQGSAARQLLTTIWKTRCRTTWPQDGSETSFTS